MYNVGIMKGFIAFILSLMPVALADSLFSTWLDDTSALAQEMSGNWRHEMPESGILPSFVSFEYVSRMRERHGGSSLSWQQYSLCVPLADPRQSGGDKWMFNASLNADVTVVDDSGTFALKNTNLYHLSLPLSAIISCNSGNTMIVSVSPTLDSDFAQSAHSFHMNLMTCYRVQRSESFSYGVGLGYAPYAGAWSVMPIVTFDWQMTPEWTLSLSGYSLRAMRDMGQGLSLGAFVQGDGGSWAVKTPQGTRLLRIRSLVAGLTAEYDFSREGQTKRIVSLSVGSTLATAADICEFNSDQDRLEAHHYKPGLYVSASLDYRF